MQLDAYAAKRNLKGMPESELPTFRQTFGMGMTVTACYIFLAIVLAPALVQSGLDPLAVHLYILYWGMVSFITPPVALGAFAAATIAGVSMRAFMGRRSVLPMGFNPAGRARGSTSCISSVPE